MGQLVLSRKIGESIVIGDVVRVTIIKIGNGRVRVLTEAPEDVVVDREEIYIAKYRSKGKALRVGHTGIPGVVGNETALP